MGARLKIPRWFENSKSFVKLASRCQRVTAKQSSRQNTSVDILGRQSRMSAGIRHSGRFIENSKPSVKTRVKVSTRHGKAAQRRPAKTPRSIVCVHSPNIARQPCVQVYAPQQSKAKPSAKGHLGRISYRSSFTFECKRHSGRPQRRDRPFHFNSASNLTPLSPFISGSLFTIRSFISATKFTIAIRQSESRNQGFLKKHHSIGKLQQHHRSTTKILASGSVGEYIVSHLRRV